MKRILWIASAMFAVLFAIDPVFAAPEIDGSLSGEPLRYTYVSGDSHKFREQNWINKNYAGGVDEFNIESKNLPEDITVSMDGHALVEDNDYEANVRIEKKDFDHFGFNTRIF